MKRLIEKEAIKNILSKSGLQNLEPREKLFLLGGLLFLIGFIFVRFAIIPAVTAKTSLEQSTERKREELVKIRELRQEYLSLKKEEGNIQDRINERGANFSLFTFLDQQAERVQVKKQIKYMKPSVIEGEDSLNENMVEMKFQLISLDSLVGFLRLVESKQNVVFIKRISIQENGTEPGALDAILQIATFEEKQ